MFGLLSSIATTYGAVQRGIDQDKARTAAEEDRQYQLGLRKQQEEDRQRQIQTWREDRDFQVGQRQRTLDEQRRADELRAADAAVPTTRSVVDPNLPQVDDDGNPIAPELRSRTVAAPRWQQLQGLADNRRKAGMVGEAMKLEDASRQEMFNDSAKRFTALKAGSGGMSAFQIAQQAQGLFNDDPYPQEVAGLEQLPGGGARVTIKDRTTGKTTVNEFKNPQEILTALEGLYSPETYGRYVEAQRAARAKAEEARMTELYKPRTLRAGETLNVYNPETGRFVKVAEGNIPPGFEVVDGPDGSPSLRRISGSGGRAEKPPKTRREMALEHFQDVWKNSTLKDTATPAQLATAQRLAGQIAEQNPNIDPLRAPEFALAAATSPESVRRAFIPAKGTIARVVAHEGSDVVIEDLGPQEIRSAKPGTYAQDAVSLLQSMPPAQADLFAAAAMDKSGKARRALVDSLVKSPQGLESIRRANGGREPTQADIQEAWRRTDADLGASLDLIGIHLPKPDRDAAWRRRPDRETAGQPAASQGLSALSTDALRRIANTPGHARQEEAADELQLRLSQRSAGGIGTNDAPAGFGLGVAP